MSKHNRERKLWWKAGLRKAKVAVALKIVGFTMQWVRVGGRIPQKIHDETIARYKAKGTRNG